MKTFVEKFIDKIDKTELDIEFPHYDGDEQNEVMIPYNKLNYVDTPSIEINAVIGILNSLKEQGADRVYIANHADHHGYYFYGVKLMEI